MSHTGKLALKYFILPGVIAAILIFLSFILPISEELSLLMLRTVIWSCVLYIPLAGFSAVHGVGALGKKVKEAKLKDTREYAGANYRNKYVSKQPWEK